jgi:[acyl-carrier-protein] S-malonyltransferase
MKTAFLFPGQGSQSVGMLADLAAEERLIEKTFREASQVLGWDVGRLVLEGPEEELNRTERTQPALLTASTAIWRVWRAHEGPQPVLLAGHSLGEYSALVAAGVLDFADALKLVELRGRLMQQAVPAGVGGMAAVLGLDDEAVARLCAEYAGPGSLEPANFNAPGQVVVGGSSEALDWLQQNGKSRGAKKVTRLAVSVPSHCALMRDAACKLAERLTTVTFRHPTIPVLHNLDAQPRSSAEGIRQALTEQLFRPVRWSATVRAMAGAGVGLFIECGPGKVLATLNKRILPDLDQSRSLTTEDPTTLRDVLQQVTNQTVPTT